MAVNAVSASVGNLGAGDRGEKSEKIMRSLFFINFWLLTVGTCIIVSVLNPFIEIWLGKEMLFSNVEMLIIAASFYFSCIRDPVQVFVSSYGLFKESKYIPVLRAALNLVLSVAFVKELGIAGVFLGTVLSTVCVPLLGEVYVLYKHGFSMNCNSFVKEMFYCIFVSFICSFVSFSVTRTFAVTPLGIAMRTVFSFCSSNVVLLAFCSSNEHFSTMMSLVKNTALKTKKLML